MGLLICIACERCREISPIRRRNYFCSNCGAYFPRIIRQKKWWTEKQYNQKNKTEALRATYAALRWIAENKKYSTGYCAVKFNIIFRYWPPDAYSDIPALPPSSNLLRFIGRQNQLWRIQKLAEEAEAKKMAPVLALAPSSLTTEANYSPSWMTEEDWQVKL
jgi:hypothetical protein